MFGDREPIGHAGDIIGHRSRAGRARRPWPPIPAAWRRGRSCRPGTGAGRSRPPVRGPSDVRMPVHAGDEKGLDIAVGRVDGVLPDQRPPGAGDRFRTVDTRFGNPPPALADRVLDEPGNEATGQLMDRARRLKAGIGSSTSRIRRSTNGTQREAGQARTGRRAGRRRCHARRRRYHPQLQPLAPRGWRVG